MRSRIFSDTTLYLLGLIGFWCAICYLTVTRQSDHSLQLRLITAIVPFVCCIIYGLFSQHIKKVFIWPVIFLFTGDIYLVWVVGEKALGVTWLLSGILGLFVGLFLLSYTIPNDDQVMNDDVEGPFGASTPPLSLREMTLSAKEAAIRNDVHAYFKTKSETAEFTPVDFEAERIELLVRFPQNFVARNGPFLSGLDFPDSKLAEIAEENLVPARCLVITDYENLLGTIYPDEVSAVQKWIQRVFHKQ